MRQAMKALGGKRDILSFDCPAAPLSRLPR